MDLAGLVKVRVQADLDPLERGFAEARQKSGAFDREASRSLKNVDSSAKDAGRSVKGMARETAVANDNFRVMGAASRLAAVGVRQIAAVAGTFGAAALAAFSIKPVFEFKDALAEVTTLVDTATFDMARLEKSALAMASAFGGGATAQVQAFNDVISAGTEDIGKATKIVEAANKLAIGGATSVTVATDALTSVLNAYGDKVKGATSVSDAMFIAMRDGKTTIDELASGLGKVAPVGAQVGVSFDELTAAVAALTLGGISTQESITGIRAMLAAVAKPTSQATKLAAQLGIEFNTTGLKAKGFAGFLKDLMAKTGGNTDALAVLFGGVEALVPAMALAGSAGDSFANTMENMAGKAGATQEAFDKMAASPGFQAGRIWSALEAEAIKAGSVMGDMLVPVLKAVADHMDDVFKVAKVAGAALLAAFAPTILAGIASGLSLIGTVGIAAIRGITLAMAANPLGALVVAVTTVITALYVFRDDIKEVFGVDVVEEAKNAANRVIGAFVGAYNAVAEAWGNLPNLFSALGKQAWNNLMAEFEKPALTYKGITILPGLDMSSLKSELTDAEKAALGGAAVTFNDAFNRDWIGDKLDGGAAGGSGSAAESIKKITEAANATIPALGGMSKESEKAARSYDKIVQSARAFIAEQEAERQGIGLTREAAAALRYEQGLLNHARRAGLTLTEADKQGFKALAEAMAQTEEKTRSLTERYEFMKDVTKGFFSDFKNDLISNMKDGMSFWESTWRAMANAAERAIDKIIDKLLNNLVDAIFQVNKAGSSGGGGGIMGWLGNLLGFGGGAGGGFTDWEFAATAASPGLWASGGYTGPGAANEAAGIVHRDEFVFNKTATARLGVSNLEAIHNAAQRGSFAKGGFTGGAMPRIAPAANSNSGGTQSPSSTSIVELRLSPDLIAAILQQAEGQSVRIIDKYDKGSIGRLARDKKELLRRAGRGS